MDLIKSQNISVVFHGSEHDVPHEGDIDPYKAAKDAGICCSLESPSKITTSVIIQRILDNSAAFRERNRKKQLKEIAEVEASKKQ